MKVSLKKAFSLLDGRLSTEMDDIYEMLNYIFDDNLYTHQLPFAIKKLKEINPYWFAEGVSLINKIKKAIGTDDFDECIKVIDAGYSNYEIELGKVDAKIPFL